MSHQSPQVHHVHQLHPGLIDGVVIVVDEETGDAVGADKAAFLIKRHGLFVVSVMLSPPPAEHPENTG